MYNKMVLNIMIIYFVILSVVLGFQLKRLNNDAVSAPSNSGAVLAEDRLNSAVVFYNDSPVLLSNKKQILLDRTNPSYTPIIKNNIAYLPVSFYNTVYGANVSYSNSNTSATIRLNNKALVVDANEAKLIDSSNEKKLETLTKPIVANNVVYVPADVFAEAYNKNVYIYGDMGVISTDEFSQADNIFLDSLVSQVNDLPYIVNEENLKSVANTRTPDDIFIDVESKMVKYNRKPQTLPVNVMSAENTNIIVNDDKYLYYGGSGKIEVLTDNEEDFIKVSEIEMPASFTVKKLILKDNKLIAAGSNIASSAATPSEEETTTQEQVETQHTNSNKSSITSDVYIYNVSDSANITLERKFSVSGYFQNISMSGNYIYMLSQNSVYGLYNNGHFIPPCYSDSVMGTVSMDFEKIQYFPETGAEDFTVISAINLESSENKPNAKAFVGAGDNIYISQNNLYVAKGRNTAFDNYENIENTCIYRYSLNKGEILPAGDAVIKGHLINSDAISEYNGYCRVVTKFTDNENNNKKVCNVYVLNNNLEICGQANKVANDDISAALFSDNEILLTPVEKGGNIYGVNIEDPTMPEGKGALKPAKGNVLIYYYDEENIITVDNANDILKLSMYNLADFNEPELLYCQELGKSSEINTSLFENKASFFFDKEKNAMFIPIKIVKSGTTVFQGAYVYNVYKDEGFNRIGEVSAENYKGVYKYKGKVCMFSDNKAVITDVNDLKKQSIIEF